MQTSTAVAQHLLLPAALPQRSDSLSTRIGAEPPTVGLMVRRSGSAEAAHDALRDQAVDDLDELIDAVADGRKDLRSYQSVLEKNRRHLAGGGRASDMAVR